MTSSELEQFSQAQNLFQSGNLAQSNLLLRQLSQRYPQDVNLLLWVAYSSEDDESAKMAIQQARWLNPNHTQLVQAERWLSQKLSGIEPPSLSGSRVNNFSSPASVLVTPPPAEKPVPQISAHTTSRPQVNAAETNQTVTNKKQLNNNSSPTIGYTKPLTTPPRPNKTIPLLFLVLGLAMLAGAAYFAYDTYSFTTSPDYSKTTATVIRLVPRDGNFYPVYRYTVAGKVYELTSSAGSNPAAEKVNDQVNLFYNRTEPNSFRAENFLSFWLASLILGGLGAIFTIVGLVGLFTNFRFGSASDDNDTDDSYSSSDHFSSNDQSRYASNDRDVDNRSFGNTDWSSSSTDSSNSSSKSDD